MSSETGTTISRGLWRATNGETFRVVSRMSQPEGEFCWIAERLKTPGHQVLQPLVCVSDGGDVLYHRIRLLERIGDLPEENSHKWSPEVLAAIKKAAPLVACERRPSQRLTVYEMKYTLRATAAVTEEVTGMASTALSGCGEDISDKMAFRIADALSDTEINYLVQRYRSSNP